MYLACIWVVMTIKERMQIFWEVLAVLSFH